MSTACLVLLLACQAAALVKGGTGSASDPLATQTSVKQRLYRRPVSTAVNNAADNAALKPGGDYRRDSYRRVPSGTVSLREPYDSSAEDERSYGKVRYHHGSDYSDSYGQPIAPEQASGQGSYNEEPAYGGEAYTSSVYPHGSYSRHPDVSPGYSKGSRTKVAPVRGGYVALPYVPGVYGSGYPKSNYGEGVPAEQPSYSPSYESTKYNRVPIVFDKGGAGTYSYGSSGRYPSVHEGYVISGYRPISAGASGSGFEGYGQGSGNDGSQEPITPYVGYYGRYSSGGYVPRDYEAVIRNGRPKGYGLYGSSGIYGDGYLGATYAGGYGSGGKTWQRTVYRGTVPVRHGFADGLVGSKTSVGTYPIMIAQLESGPNLPPSLSARVEKTSRYWR